MATYWLSLHVPYACRHSGACCSSGWDIPIERARVAAVALLRPDGTWLHPARGAPPEVAGILAVAETGHCVFHRQGCEIQHVLGHVALPTACQHFPREVLHDPRGTFVTLSHYCPTAADLLFSHQGPVEIVEGPAVLPDGDPEGLDARDVLPPLLWVGSGRDQRGQVGMLMDWDAYSAWEAHMVRTLTAGAGGPADRALDTLDDDLARLTSWRPGAVSLAQTITALAPPGHANGAAALAAGSADDEVVIRRYLAARAFASWTAYDPGGVGAVLHGLRMILRLLRRLRRRQPLKEAIRQADLQVVHLAPRARSGR